MATATKKTSAKRSSKPSATEVAKEEARQADALAAEQKAHGRARRPHRRVGRAARRLARRLRAALGGFHNLGPDVSFYQGNVLWGKVAKVASWGCAKAGGADRGLYRDPAMSAARIAAMRRAFAVIIVYYFASPSGSATAQGNHFAEICKEIGITHGDQVALDYETAGGVPDSFIAALWKAFNQAFKPHVERWLYGPYWLLAGLKKKHGCRFWVAAYPDIVGIPAVFAKDPDILHQFTDHQVFPGIASPCDASSFVRGKRGFKAAFVHKG